MTRQLFLTAVKRSLLPLTGVILRIHLLAIVLLRLLYQFKSSKYQYTGLVTHESTQGSTLFLPFAHIS